MRILISQSLYDQIGRRLAQHHKGHKGVSEFPMLKASLERNARIEAGGVEVDLTRLEIVASAIEDNIRFTAGRYASGPDKMLLLDIADAIADHQAKLVPPASALPPVGDQSLTNSKPDPLQSLQQDGSDLVGILSEYQSPPVVIPKPHQWKTEAINRRQAYPPAPTVSRTMDDQQTANTELGDPPEGCIWMANDFGGYEAVSELVFPECA